MTIIKIDIEEDLTDLEYDFVNKLFMRKAKELGILDKYSDETIHWGIQCRIGEKDD
jgi:hypothetical protein